MFELVLTLREGSALCSTALARGTVLRTTRRQWEKDLGKTRTIPLDRTRLGWEFKLSGAHSLAEPCQELLFVSLD